MLKRVRKPYCESSCLAAVYCHISVVNTLPSARARAHPLFSFVLSKSASFGRLHCEAALVGRFDATDKRNDQRARAIYTNGDTYFGQYSNDRRQGVGLYLVAKGGGYAGSYAESKRSGPGVMRMPDGAMYQGEFAGDKFEGQGQYEYVDSSTYVGAWKAGKKHGEVCCGDCLTGSHTPRVCDAHCGRLKWLMTCMSCQSIQNHCPSFQTHCCQAWFHDQGMPGNINDCSASC